MDFLTKHWGDLASVLGFSLTIWFAWSAKAAAEQAREAANEVRDQISRFDTPGKPFPESAAAAEMS